MKEIENVKQYEASVKPVELSMSIDGNNYLVIYGKHINGGFIAIPNWNVCCEASYTGDTFYNTEKLMQAGIDPEHAGAIAHGIKVFFEEE